MIIIVLLATAVQTFYEVETAVFNNKKGKNLEMCC